MQLSDRATERRREFYTHGFDLWRSAEVINATTDPGKVENPTWVKVLFDVPCMFQSGTSELSATEGGPIDEDDNLLTLDERWTEAGIDLQVGDGVYQTIGPEAGSWFTMCGNPKVRLRLNFQVTNCSRRSAPPEARRLTIPVSWKRVQVTPRKSEARSHRQGS